MYTVYIVYCCQFLFFSLSDFIETYCNKNPTSRFQNPDHCAQYYDCSDASFSPGLGPFLKECPFPQLFNPVNNICADASVVSCYERYTPLNKCKYERFFFFLQIGDFFLHCNTLQY